MTNEKQIALLTPIPKLTSPHRSPFHFLHDFPPRHRLFLFLTCHLAYTSVRLHPVLHMRQAAFTAHSLHQRHPQLYSVNTRHSNTTATQKIVIRYNLPTRKKCIIVCQLCIYWWRLQQHPTFHRRNSTINSRVGQHPAEIRGIHSWLYIITTPQ